jgi:hypothetical protein
MLNLISVVHELLLTVKVWLYFAEDMLHQLTLGVKLEGEII